MADFGLDKPFLIDNGELDDNSKQQCFVLGYELAQIDSLLQSSKAFSKPVHADNRERIALFCETEGREFELKWMDEDASESWMWLDVKAK